MSSRLGIGMSVREVRRCRFLGADNSSSSQLWVVEPEPEPEMAWMLHVSFLPPRLIELVCEEREKEKEILFSDEKLAYLVQGSTANANADLGLPQAGNTPADPFQRIDWNAFMDDFDWSFTSTGNYLGGVSSLTS